MDKYLPEKKIKQSDIPGFNKDRLNPLSFRGGGSSGGGNFFIGYFTFNTTGNINISGLGFTPKMVKFNYVDQVGGAGIGAMTSTNQYAIDIVGSGTEIQTECIYLRNSGGTAIGRAVYVSMNSDGFTINATLAATTIRVNYEAFG